MNRISEYRNEPYTNTDIFNGRTVRVGYNEAWEGEPGQWFIECDDEKPYVINNENYFDEDSEQEDFIWIELIVALKGNQKGIAEIRHLFDTDWVTVGNEETVLSFVLNLVGYNTVNAHEDEVRIINIHEQLKLGVDNLATHTDDLVDFRNHLVILKGFLDNKEKEIIRIQKRLDVFEKMQNGEPFTRRWTTKSFWDTYAGTETGDKVAAILSGINDNKTSEGK